MRLAAKHGDEWRDRLSYALIALIIGRVRTVNQSFARLAARTAAGPRPRPRATASGLNGAAAQPRPYCSVS